eukprot:TRINITY_DN4236_c0_g1_i8.p3 TRINITY_DN4236_c0_g1~~TRINITY_DN4236_c0_g1_i8.p3  ORF type:complete len:113 (-),score=17.01 TRINITY_DN4236_c0_g1_i8:174-512(-)
MVTVLLNYILQKHEEVIYAVSPGAGGYDSVCVLGTSKLSAESLKEILGNFKIELNQDPRGFISEYLGDRRDALGEGDWDYLIKLLQGLEIDILPVKMDPTGRLRIKIFWLQP